MIRTLVSSFLVLSLLACATAPISTPPASAPPIWAGLKPGPYAVGFRSWLVQTPPHPLQISVWYPALSGGQSMTYRDYLLLSLTETKTEEPTPAQRDAGIAEFTKFLTGAGLSEQSVGKMVDTPMFARRDAPSVSTKQFPMVFVAQGNGQTAAAQAVLSEFLASHGYVVVSIPSITRLTAPIERMAQVGPKSWEQAQDIERAVSAIADLPVDSNIPILLVGHSFGARGALFYAMHHKTGALVSLEGGIAAGGGTQSMLDMKEFDLTKPIPPVLHFYELNEDRMNPDFRLLRSLRTPDLELVRKNSMMHVHFTTDGFGAILIPELAKVTKAGPDLKNEVVSMAQKTLAFLDKQTHLTR